jgi:hypothetical protein
LVALQGSRLARNWDLGRQIGDEHGVLIECRDVHKSFGDKHVLKGVSFKVTSTTLFAFSSFRALFETNCLY